MPRYRIEVTRKTFSTCIVEVEADNDDAARDAAKLKAKAANDWKTRQEDTSYGAWIKAPETAD